MSRAPPHLDRQGSTVVILAVDAADHAIVRSPCATTAPNNSTGTTPLFRATRTGQQQRRHAQATNSTASTTATAHTDGALGPKGVTNHDARHIDDCLDDLTLRFKRVDVKPVITSPRAPRHTRGGSTTTLLKPSSDAGSTSDGSASQDDSLEQGFLADFFDRYSFRVQMGMITAVCIWALYFINDVQKNEAGLRKNFSATIIIRFVNCFIGLLCAAALSTPFIKQRKLLMPLVGLALITFGVAQILFGMWDENELDPAYSAIMLLIPSTSSTLFKQRFIFTVVFQWALLLLYVLITYFFDSFHSASDLGLTAIGLAFANCLFAAHAYRREYKMRKDYLIGLTLEQEEVRSQNLLLRMLPVSVIARLREGSDFIYYKHPVNSVTLLFSHIHDFDMHVSAMTPMQLIRALNALFLRFDALTDVHGLYKVETIGDVYLVAGGCPLEYSRPDHADAVALFALAMMQASKKFMLEHVRDVGLDAAPAAAPTVSGIGANAPATGKLASHKSDASRLQPIQLRIGLHSGGLISGVVGLKYPRFRLIGDTVNTCSRLSTTALPDQIQMSAPTFEKLTKETFETNYRGEIPMKGKGLVKTYILQGKAPNSTIVPRNLEEVQKGNGTLETYKAAHTFRDSTSAAPNQSDLNEKQSGLHPSSLHPTIYPSLDAHSSASIQMMSPHGVSVVELLPSELPGVPEMLHKLRSGALAEEEPSRSSIALHDYEPPTALSGGVSVVEVEHSQLASFIKLEDGGPPATPLMHPNRGSSLGGGTPGMLTPSQRPRATARIMSTNMISSTTERSSADSRVEHSTSSSTSLDKRVITAAHHDGGRAGKSARLFSFGTLDAVLRPKRKWYQILHQNFADHIFEYEFQHVYAKDRHRNRLVMNMMWVFLLPLSMYDVFNNPEVEGFTVVYTWIVRLAGIGAGVAFYYYSQRREYLRNMQLVTGLTVAAVGVSYTWTTVITSALLKSYGVGFVLMYLCLVCLFMGLQFLPALAVCATVMVSWIIAAVTFEGTLPGIASVLLAGMVMYLETSWTMEMDARHDFVHFRKLFHERMSTHAFLSNMLPSQVFEGLRRDDQRLVAHERLSADVLFSDIVGFTSIASLLKPEDTVALLNVMFSTFDSLAEKYNVYKVETIGDAFVGCCNVVSLRSDHTKCMVDFALAISRASRSMYTPSQQQLVIRVGIHTGPVIAGVVGRKMPRYHLFGETYSLAEVMEQKGVPGKVSLSAASWRSMPSGSAGHYTVSPLEAVQHGAHTIQRFTIERATKVVKNGTPQAAREAAARRKDGATGTIVSGRRSAPGRALLDVTGSPVFSPSPRAQPPALVVRAAQPPVQSERDHLGSRSGRLSGRMPPSSSAMDQPKQPFASVATAAHSVTTFVPLPPSQVQPRLASAVTPTSTSSLPAPPTPAQPRVLRVFSSSAAVDTDSTADTLAAKPTAPPTSSEVTLVDL